MNRINKPLSFLLLLAVMALFIGSGCAEIKRSRIIQSTKKASCEMSEMGKNKYFHSKHYKRNISHSTRKIRRR